MTVRWTLLAVGTCLLFGATPILGAPSGIVIAVGNTTASSPGVATFTVTLSGVAAGGAEANNAQVDIIFDAVVFAVPATGSAACVIDPRLGSLAHTQTLPSSPPVPAGMQRLRLSVIDLGEPSGLVTDGRLYTCSLRVLDTAPLGATTLLATNQNVGDANGISLPSSTVDGMVTIIGPGEPLPTASSTPTPTLTQSPTTTSTSTPTPTPTGCPVGDQAGSMCAGGALCNCVDDCPPNPDMNVFGNEVTMAVSIVAGSADLSACPSADANCDGDVFGNEVTIGVNNVANGCPGAQ